jgi:3-oxoadipate enol-lactonase
MPYVRTGLGRWFFEEVGAEKAKGDAAIVLLPSLLTDGGMWRGQIAPLAALGRVIVIDGPGHGKSDVPPPFTLEDHAQALLQAWDQLGIERAVAVGLSWGGMLSMRLAISHPERLAAMVLLDTNADAPVLRERIEYRALVALTRRIGLPPLLVRRKIVPLMFSRQTVADSPALVDGFLRTLGGFSIEGLARATLAVSIERKTILEALRTVTLPTLVGCGAEDLATPPVHSRRIASRIARATLVSFDGAGHLSALENPRAVNAAVVPFVREHIAAHRSARAQN